MSRRRNRIGLFVLMPLVVLSAWSLAETHTQRATIPSSRLRNSSEIGPVASADLDTLMREALDDDVAMAMPATAALRARGQEAVDALWHAHGSEAPTSRFRAVLDSVCAQKDCDASRLYWYTNLDRAVAEAKATHRPILSLRLLGRLDEELSCANSRFFRTILYSDPRVADYLRAHFVLHWESVRPVPKVTIDFGDGRSIQTTITGNSIHYVLDENGLVVDALPGLYSAQKFRAELERAATEADVLARATDTRGRDAALRTYLDARSTETAASWDREMHALGTPRPLPMPPNEIALGAADVMPTAITKMIVEQPVLRQVSPATVTAETKSVLDDPVWTALAREHLSEHALSPESRAVVRRKYLARQPAPPPADQQALLDALELSLATDTIRNEYLLRRTIQTWLSMRPELARQLGELNNKVYADLFRTPRSDPWLGLLQDGVFTGLPGNGAVGN